MKAEDLDPPEFHLSVLNQHIRDMMNGVLRRHDLKLVEWRVLQCLAEQGALSVCDLSALAVIERTATGRLIDRLAQRGFVAKKQMPNDRRFAQISLRSKGQKKLDVCAGDVAHARTQLFAGLDPRDLEKFLDTLSVLQLNVTSALQAKAPARMRRA